MLLHDACATQSNKGCGASASCGMLAAIETLGGNGNDEIYSPRPADRRWRGRCRRDPRIGVGARPGLAEPPRHHHLSVGRRRRHGCDGAHRRGRAREGTQAALQRRQPHRRLGRGRPFGDRHGGARRLHARHHHRRDLDDALAGAHRAEARQLHAARPHERGSARHPGHAGSPYKTVKELADAIKAAPAGKLKASGTGQGGIWHLALVGWLHGHGPEARSRGLGAVQRRGAGHAGPRRRRPRSRHLLGAGSARHHRGRQGAQPRRHGGRAQPAFKDVPTLKEAMGIDYTDRRLARFCGAQGPAGRHRQRADRRPQEGQRGRPSSASSWPTAASA